MNNNISKISFKIKTTKCAEILNKLRNDNSNKQHFYHAVTEAYLLDDKEFLEWWNKYLLSIKYPKIRLKAKIKLINEGKELEKDFALLNDEEIENIFDILENFED
jgi:hypothetical protein